MKSASSSLRTSLAMALSLSWAKTLFFYRTGVTNGHTLSLCTIILGLILNMPSWLQAKMSRLFLRKRASFLWTEVSACMPIQVVWLGVHHLKRLHPNPSSVLQWPFFPWYSRLVSDRPSQAWLCSNFEWPSSLLALLLSRTPLEILLAGGI